MQRTEKRMSWPVGPLLKTYLLLSGLSLLPLLSAYGQPLNTSASSVQWDSLPKRPATFRWVAPAVLIPAGLALTPDYTNSHLDRFYVRGEIQDKIHFRTHAEDYLQYGPA